MKKELAIALGLISLLCLCGVGIAENLDTTPDPVCKETGLSSTPFQSQSIEIPEGAFSHGQAIAVDPYGNTYLAYIRGERVYSNNSNNGYETDSLIVKYLQVCTTVATSTAQWARSELFSEEGYSRGYTYSVCDGARIVDVSIAIDPTGGIQISYVLQHVVLRSGILGLGDACYNGDQLPLIGENFLGDRTIEVIKIPKLLTLIPGINDHGEAMTKGVLNLASVDDSSILRICEADKRQTDKDQKCDVVAPLQTDNKGLSLENEQKIRENVRNRLQQAQQSAKDLAILVDMDLENYATFPPLLELLVPPDNNRWVKRSVPWGATVANIVSDEFSTINKLGSRVLIAHSAGGDAANKSVEQSYTDYPGKRMYDHLIILNGRTKADTFKKHLQAKGYMGWQVKVFTNHGDFPAILELPVMQKLLAILGLGSSLSNWDAVRNNSGADSWTGFYCSNPPGCNPYKLGGCHSALRDAIQDNDSASFKIAYGSSLYSTPADIQVREAAMTDWRPRLVN